MKVARPGLMEALVEEVTRPGISAVGMTTGLWGAGGFGKTTLARLLAHRKEIRERFCDGGVWVSVGENAAGPELAEKVTSVVGLLGGASIPSNRGDSGCSGVERGGWSCGARVRVGQAGPARVFCLRGRPCRAYSRAHRRCVVRSAMRSTLEVPRGGPVSFAGSTRPTAAPAASVVF